MTLPVRIKRSNVNGAPASLLEGELAFSNDYATHTGDGSLYIGADDDASGVAVRKIGGVNGLEKSLFDANTILAANTDNTPLALTVPEQTLVGRITAGTIDALTPAEVRTLLNINEGATPDQNAFQTVTGNSGTATADSVGDAIAITGLSGIITAALAGVDAALTVSLTDTAVVAGSYGDAATVPAFTVDQQGRLTTVANTPIQIAETQITDGMLLARVADNETILGNWDFTGGTITVPQPVADNHAATKMYVDSVAQGLDVKNSVRAATTATVSLTGLQTVDGISLIAGDRLLVKDQGAASQNGIYIVGAGTWPRTEDGDTWTELVAAFVFVEEGTQNKDTGWNCIVDAGGALETTDVDWTQFSGAGTYTAGAGLNLLGSEFAVHGGAAGQVLVSQGVSSDAAWDALNVADAASIAGLLPASHGGTGVDKPAVNSILYGSAADTMGVLAGAAGGVAGAHYILAQPADGGAPAWMTEVDGGTY